MPRKIRLKRRQGVEIPSELTHEQAITFYADMMVEYSFAPHEKVMLRQAARALQHVVLAAEEVEETPSGELSPKCGYYKGMLTTFATLCKQLGIEAERKTSPQNKAKFT